MKENDKLKHEDKMTQNNVKINSKTMTAQQKGPSDWLCFYHVCSILLIWKYIFIIIIIIELTNFQNKVLYVCL